MTDPVVTDPIAPPMDDHDHGTMPVPTDPADVSFTVIASTTDVSVLVDTAGLAYVSESGGDPIAITRSDDYWQGSVPLSRGGATIMAAARDGPWPSAVFSMAAVLMSMPGFSVIVEYSLVKTVQVTHRSP